MNETIPLKEGWADNGGLQLHYIQSNLPEPQGLPLVFIPGALGAADDYIMEFPQLAPRPCLALSLRGQGQSSAPDTGYTFAHYMSDIEAVLDQSGLRRFCLMGYSMAAPMVIEYTARHPDRAVGLIIGDYPARYPRLPDDWPQRAQMAFGGRVADHVPAAMQQDSAEVDLWPRLADIACPVLVLYGSQPGALLRAADVARYRASLARPQIVEFPDSDHQLWQPDYDKFIETIQAYLAQLDLAQLLNV
ncbi:MAG: alpha/beta hydrolase [Chloroflexota bacterium]